MSDLLKRHLSQIKRLIGMYRAGDITLNSLSQQLQTLSEVVDDENWRVSSWPIILALEEENAVALDTKLTSTMNSNEIISKALDDMEQLVIETEKRRIAGGDITFGADQQNEES
jgi:hypothetical protein